MFLKLATMFFCGKDLICMVDKGTERLADICSGLHCFALHQTLRRSSKTNPKRDSESFAMHKRLPREFISQRQNSSSWFVLVNFICMLKIYVKTKHFTDISTT